MPAGSTGCSERGRSREDRPARGRGRWCRAAWPTARSSSFRAPFPAIWSHRSPATRPPDGARARDGTAGARPRTHRPSLSALHPGRLRRVPAPACGGGGSGTGEGRDRRRRAATYCPSGHHRPFGRTGSTRLGVPDPPRTRGGTGRPSRAASAGASHRRVRPRGLSHHGPGRSCASGGRCLRTGACCPGGCVGCTSGWMPAGDAMRFSRPPGPSSGGGPPGLAGRLQRAGAPAVLWWQPEGGAARVMAGSREAYPATVFQQVYPAMAGRARAHAIEQLGPLAGAAVWDLYAGTGDTTLALVAGGARCGAWSGIAGRWNWPRRASAGTSGLPGPAPSRLGGGAGRPGGRTGAAPRACGSRCHQPARAPAWRRR